MSQSSGAAKSEGAEVRPALESLQRILSAQAEDQELAAARTMRILGRFFKLALIIVGLNVVIAGANLVMIVSRPRVSVLPAVVQAPPEAPRPSLPAPPAPESAAAPVTPAPATTPSAATSEAPAAKVTPPQSEKKVPLLGPLPVAKPAGTTPARRPAALVIKPAPVRTLARAVVAAEVEEQEDAESTRPPERW